MKESGETMNGDTQKRVYDNTLRKQQQELTTRAIMEAVKGLILQGKIHNFTMQKVAELSGVSYATIYRHYNSKEELVIAYRDWCMKNIAPEVRPYVNQLEELPEWAGETVLKFWDNLTEIKALHVALSMLQIKGAHPESLARDEWIKSLVSDAAPDVPEEVRTASATVIRHLVSVMSWVEFHSRYGLDEVALVQVVKEGIKGQIYYLKLLQNSK